MSATETIAEMRRDLHEELHRIAYCFGRQRTEGNWGEDFGNDFGGTRGDLLFEVTCRVTNDRIQPVGDIKGEDWLERLEYTDLKLIFVTEEFIPQKKDEIVLSATEGYLVRLVEPPHGITTSAQVVHLNKSRITELWQQVLNFQARESNA